MQCSIIVFDEKVVIEYLDSLKEQFKEYREGWDDFFVLEREEELCTQLIFITESSKEREMYENFNSIEIS